MVHREIGRLARAALAAAAAMWLLGTASAGAQQLPDGRAYEMVSPPAKNGGDVLVDAQRTWAAADGSAVAYASLAGFGDVAGTGIATDYLAERSNSSNPGSNGWSTKGISPVQGPLPVPLVASAFEPMHLLFSPDLTRAVYQASSPLTDDPFVAHFPNLYEQGGLRGGGTPSFSLVTACPYCQQTATPLAPFEIRNYNGLALLDSMSADGAHVVFESTLKLTADAHDGSGDGAFNVYDASGGTVRLASILPDGTPAASALAGQGNWTHARYMTHVLSADGVRTIFTVPAPANCLLSVFNYNCGDLYVRESGPGSPRTLQVNASERSPAAAHEPAVYWDASTDGSRIFFTSTEPLTNDANGSSNLYMFEPDAPAGSRLTRLSVQDPSLAGTPSDVSSVIGSSEDGHTVYFTATAQLVAGAPAIPAASSGVFAWSDRAWGSGGAGLRFIGVMSPNGGNLDRNSVTGQNWAITPRQSRVSPDGRFLLFGTTAGTELLSVRGGTDYVHNGFRELYAYDLLSDSLACASCRPDGQPATTDASVAAEHLIGAALFTSYQNRALSTGGKVFFNTAEALVPEDVNDANDAYEWDPASGVHLLSDGVDAGGSYFLDASADGDDVFVATRARLVGWDTDDSFDLYDARVGGGFPPPPPPAAGCATIEDCHGSVPPQPSVASIGTAGVGRSGNVSALRLECARGYVRGTVHGRSRCVRKPVRRARCRRGTVRRKVRGHVRCVRRARRSARRTAGGAR